MYRLYWQLKLNKFKISMHSKQFLLQMIAYNESISRISDIIQNVSFKSGYNNDS